LSSSGSSTTAPRSLWIDAGGFPRGIKIPGPYGKTLVWIAVEVARLIAQRVGERDASSENDKGAPSQGRPLDSDSPLAADRNKHEQVGCVPPPST
jgi:hypothetical protein